MFLHLRVIFFLIFSFLLFRTTPLHAQRKVKTTEVGLQGGVSYYVGDLNPTGHFKYISPAGGIYFRRNYNSRWSFKSGLLYGKVSASDVGSSSTFQLKRNLNFTSTIIELSGHVEFNFHPFIILDDNNYATSYVFIGLGGFYFNPAGGTDGSTAELQPLKTEGVSYSKFNVAMPFGLGVKLKPSHRFMLGAEWGLRKTYTDYIDDVSTVYPVTGNQRGDSKHNDWYSFALVSLSIRIGEKPSDCYYQ